ncbi:MAG: HupE/UreJ family protein [Nitratireductor sp.]
MQTENSLIRSQYRAHSFTIIVALCAVLIAFMNVGKSHAHEIQPSIADLKLISENRYQIEIQTNVEALLAKIGPEHDDTEQSDNAKAYNDLRASAPQKVLDVFEGFKGGLLNDVMLSFDGKRAALKSVRLEVPEIGDIALPRDSLLVFEGDVPAGAKNFEWQWPEAYGASVIRLNEPGIAKDDGYAAYLKEGAKSDSIALVNAAPQTMWQTIVSYVEIGFTHIIPKGLDHILFVVGLFLLSVKLKPLLWQVTAFTIAHTVTLALGMLGYITLSPAIVEPIIAASIAYVAIENILTDKLNKWRPIIVFCFGLLHGLGFAGVLGEIGLSSTNFVTGLIAFNVGVELGQLAVLALCFLCVGIWFGQKPWYRKFISIPASLLIAAVALWWVYERVFIV